MITRNSPDGSKNIVGKQVKELREANGLSQRGLAQKLQLKGYDMEKSTITKIEGNKRQVTDMELKAFVEIFGVDYGYLINGKTDE